MRVRSELPSSTASQPARTTTSIRASGYFRRRPARVGVRRRVSPRWFSLIRRNFTTAGKTSFRFPGDYAEVVAAPVPADQEVAQAVDEGAVGRGPAVGVLEGLV